VFFLKEAVLGSGPSCCYQFKAKNVSLHMQMIIF